MGIAQSILDIVEQEMARHGATRVSTIRLVVGEFTAVVPHSLTFCFEIITKDTPFEGVKLEMEQVPLTGRCSGCGEEFVIKEYRFVCPKCQSQEIETVAGKELFIKEIEAE
ncbi:MAG: hydrogenase maturation nickel metallochaperone HypA [Deltaproteobacteria bacterium]|nr:hydrogenase maturation nickel metallochaperone HypA [Deltaproteobacteria bacterium]